VQDLSEEGHRVRVRALGEVREEARRRRDAEKDPLVRGNLDLMFRLFDRMVRTAEITDRRYLPYVDVASSVYNGLRDNCYMKS
jgi:hypothetical protein